jgi:hypothetical protein
MEWNTPVSISKPSFMFSYHDKILFLGSCFAEEIGQKLSEDKFTVDINPFGTLYNPASVALSVRRLLTLKPFVSADLFEHEGVHHSFVHHSRFSALSEKEMLEKINRQLQHAADNLAKTSRLVVTFGTAYAYHLKNSRQVVSNCHKLPEKLFERQMIPASDVVNEWNNLLLMLWQQNPDLRLLFTVSPIRHWKDGAHLNQISKATLLLAIHELQTRHPERIAYFPAYEIMMDELRDYRFYADDMLHPSPLAVEYIRKRFCRSFLSAESQAILDEWTDIRKAIRHKPFQPGSKSYQQFAMQTLLKTERFSRKFPYFDLSKELEQLRSETT